MLLDVALGRKVVRVRFNDPKLVVSFNLPDGDPKPSVEVHGDMVRAWLGDQVVEISFKLEGMKSLAYKKLGVYEHVLGLGEKALPLDRRRVRVVFWNYDNYNYKLGTDPLYKSIPFALFIERGMAVGVFVNTATYSVFDMGVGEYDKAVFEVYEPSMELYIIFGPAPMDVIEAYTDLTGKPLLPPKWALGYHMSRYSYYPQERVLEIVGEVLKYVPVSVVHLDIDYMDNYKQFTWDRSRFPDPKGFVEKLHSLGVRVVTIIDPYIKVEPGYRVFEEGLKHLARTEKNEISLFYGWPGLSGIPDFYNKEARDWWARMIEEWVREYGIDGVWLDMNEPSGISLRSDLGYTEGIFRGYFERMPLRDARSIASIYQFYRDVVALSDKTPDPNAIHRLDDGRIARHYQVRNAYPFFQAMATYEGLVRVYKRPFILSRSAFPGIQRYAFVWTGDIGSTWESLRLSIPMILSISVSGIPWVGTDIGGFIGWAEPELVARWYQAMALAPFFRAHRIKHSNDTEIYTLPSIYREMAVKAIELRHRFLPYLWHLAWEAHLTGRPIIRALPLEFPDDEDAYRVDDEYMVGSYVLYAPIVEKGSSKRSVYLPRGLWYEYWVGEIFEGGSWIESRSQMPLYIRKGSAIPLQNSLIIYGEGSWIVYHGEEDLEEPRRTLITFDGEKIIFQRDPMVFEKLVILGKSIEKARIDSKEIQVKCDKNACEITISETPKEITLH